MKLMDIFFSLMDGYDPPIMLPHEAIMAWRPTDPRRYDSVRAECIKTLRESNRYILDGHFTPTKAANTDITVTFNRARQQHGETLIQVAQ